MEIFAIIVLASISIYFLLLMVPIRELCKNFRTRKNPAASFLNWFNVIFPLVLLAIILLF